MRFAWVVRAALALVVRPVLWGTAVRQLLVLAVDGWYRRPPRPCRLRLHRFRMQCVRDADRVGPADLVTYLHWCRAWPRISA
jgi:hypothetical protein